MITFNKIMPLIGMTLLVTPGCMVRHEQNPIIPNGIYNGIEMGGIPSIATVRQYEKSLSEPVDFAAFRYALTRGGAFPKEICDQMSQYTQAAPFIQLYPQEQTGVEGFNPLSSDTDLIDVSTGRFGSGFKTFARGAAKWGHPLFVSFAPPMSDADRLETDSNVYKNAFLKTREHFKGYGASNVTWVWETNLGDKFENFYPGDDVVDWIALHVNSFSSYSVPLPWDKIRAYNKPFIIVFDQEQRSNPQGYVYHDPAEEIFFVNNILPQLKQCGASGLAFSAPGIIGTGSVRYLSVLAHAINAEQADFAGTIATEHPSTSTTPAFNPSTSGQEGSVKGLAIKSFNEAFETAKSKSDISSMCDIAKEVVKSDIDRSLALHFFREALNMARAKDDYGYGMSKVAAEMAGSGFINEVLIEAKGFSEATNAVDLLSEIDINILLKGYKTVIPFLLDKMEKRTTQCNGWNNWWDESYSRPTYEAAELIGKIAKMARKDGNQEALQLIKASSLKPITSLLSFSNPRPGIDYGYVYIVHPIRSTAIRALVDIGDASVIPDIEQCGDINYKSPYNGDYYSVAKDKSAAITYLKAQAANKGFIEPPKSYY